MLDLYLSEDGDLLFSSGGDSVINVRGPVPEPTNKQKLTPVGVVHADF